MEASHFTHFNFAPFFSALDSAVRPSFESEKPQKQKAIRKFPIKRKMWPSVPTRVCWLEAERCISLRLQEANGGNNRKPFKHFSLPPAFLYCYERRSQFRLRSRFPSFDNDLCCSEISVKLKYINIWLCSSHQHTHSGRTNVSDIAHRLLPFDVLLQTRVSLGMAKSDLR